MAEAPLSEQIKAVKRVVDVRRKTFASGRSFVELVSSSPAVAAETVQALEREDAALEAALKTLKRLAWTGDACPDCCDHTIKEHCAFDDGVMAGERGEDDEACPHIASDLREAWLTGHSVGSINRENSYESTANSGD